MYHLAIYNSKTFKRDYIDLILSGEKAADIKILNKRIAPFHKVSEGDIVFLKESGGGVRGSVSIKSVNNYTFDDPSKLLKLMENVAKDLGMRDLNAVIPWWEKVAGKRYATVFYFAEPYRLKKDVKIIKNDRRSWVTDYIPSFEIISAFKDINIKQF